MALTPSIVAPTNSRAVNATDVVVAVDVTGSMAVKTRNMVQPNSRSRLDVAKQAVKDVTALYPNSSFAALRFGASGTLDVPLFERDRQLGGYTRARSDFRFGRFDVGCPYRPAAADLQSPFMISSTDDQCNMMPDGLVQSNTAHVLIIATILIVIA